MMNLIQRVSLELSLLSLRNKKKKTEMKKKKLKKKLNKKRNL